MCARHPKPGCAVTSECGDIFMDYYGHNIRTTAGTDWQAQVMCKLSSPPTQCNYIALTNTAITPAIADTTLSGEISSNGLRAREKATHTPIAPQDWSTPGAPTGYRARHHWIHPATGTGWRQPTRRGGTVLSSSGTTSAANATLSTTNYVDVSWTAVTAATGYKVWRTTSSSAPSGSTANLVQNSAFCNGTACHVYDISNSLNTDSIPASQQTYAGSLTLVYTWTATGAQSAQAFGVFNAASTGTLCFEGNLYAGVAEHQRHAADHGNNLLLGTACRPLRFASVCGRSRWSLRNGEKPWLKTTHHAPRTTHSSAVKDGLIRLAVAYTGSYEKDGKRSFPSALMTCAR